MAWHGRDGNCCVVSAGVHSGDRVKPHPGRSDPSIYPHKIDIQTRFADVDLQFHLNNVRIVELYQEARSSFNLILWERSNLDARSRRLLVVRQSIDYLGEARWPGAVSIGVGVSHTGNTSYSIGMAMFQNGQCVGISDTVLVYATEQGPAPIPEQLRAVLATKMLPRNVRP
jgi:acyl-CoA thioester hydrolase